MTNFAQVKVPNGKLLQLEQLSSDKYKITGDFFCYPESAITELEKELQQGCNQMKIEQVFLNNNIIGFGLEDLISLYNQLNT